MGRVREHTPPAVTLASDGHATKKSLEATLASVARFSTSHASYRRIEAAYACVPGTYARMLSYTMARKAMNHDPDRITYWTLFNNCMTFTQQTMAMGGALTRSGTIPSPADWIEDVRDDYPDLDFDANSGTVTVNYASIFQSMFKNGSLPSWAVYKGFFRSTFEGDIR